MAILRLQAAIACLDLGVLEYWGILIRPQNFSHHSTTPLLQYLDIYNNCKHHDGYPFWDYRSVNLSETTAVGIQTQLSNWLVSEHRKPNAERPQRFTLHPTPYTYLNPHPATRNTHPAVHIQSIFSIRNLQSAIRNRKSRTPQLVTRIQQPTSILFFQSAICNPQSAIESPASRNS